MDELKCPPWKQLYESALLEVDSQKLLELIKQAETAIEKRLRDLRFDSDHHAERHTIDDAQRTLRFLRGSVSVNK